MAVVLKQEGKTRKVRTSFLGQHEEHIIAVDSSTTIPYQREMYRNRFELVNSEVRFPGKAVTVARTIAFQVSSCNSVSHWVIETNKSEWGNKIFRKNKSFSPWEDPCQG